MPTHSFQLYNNYTFLAIGKKPAKKPPPKSQTPPLLRGCVCADTLGGFRYPALPFDPISLVLAQRNGVEPPKKGAFLPRRLHHPRERSCRGGRDVPRPTWGGAWWLTGHSSQLDAVGGDVGASSPWERRAGPNSPRGGTLKRVSLGLHPVSLRKSKEMGWNGQLGPQSTAQENGAHAQTHRHPPAPRPKSGEERIVYRLVALTRMVEPPG